MKFRKSLLVILIASITQIAIGFDNPTDSLRLNKVDTSFVEEIAIIEEFTMNTYYLDYLDSLLVSHFDFLVSACAVPDEYTYSKEDDVPQFDDNFIKCRLIELNEVIPFDVRENDDIVNYIKLYAYKRRKLTAKMQGLGELYFPVFTHFIEKYNVPHELKYLPIIESAMNPVARSRMGAVGLWQFMPRTGQYYGLEINSAVDERSDLYRSTEAACRYLSHLYEIYGDWNMSLAAYNAGPGNVNKAIRRSGGRTNYWDIQPYLPTETQGYVPAFLAVTYVMNFSNELNIKPIKPEIAINHIDTITVFERVEFAVLSKYLGMSVQEISYFNPSYKLNAIPKIDKHQYLVLPVNYIKTFSAFEDSIYHHSSTETFKYAQQFLMKEHTHIVTFGETIQKIAEKYDCTVQQIKAWNTMASENLRVGRKLLIYIEDKNQPYVASRVPIKNLPATSSSATATSSGKVSYYTVKSGDSLYVISKKYNTSMDKIKALNPNVNFNKLQIGTKLKISN
ncbi:MAG: LysM peptidoglycan-binding domain-containing protein [Flavobacteriales bacterium]